MEKKYQIFISSTYKDLIEARSKVRDAILSMMHFPVGMQPFYSARSLPIIDPAIFNNSNSSVFESISIRDNSIFAECNQLPHQ